MAMLTALAVEAAAADWGVRVMECDSAGLEWGIRAVLVVVLVVLVRGVSAAVEGGDMEPKSRVGSVEGSATAQMRAL